LLLEPVKTNISSKKEGNKKKEKKGAKVVSGQKKGKLEELTNYF